MTLGMLDEKYQQSEGEKHLWMWDNPQYCHCTAEAASQDSRQGMGGLEIFEGDLWTFQKFLGNPGYSAGGDDSNRTRFRKVRQNHAAVPVTGVLMPGDTNLSLYEFWDIFEGID